MSLLVEVHLFFLLDPVSAEEVGKILREGRAGHDGIAAGFDGLCLQVSLKVGEETDDGGAALQLRLQLWN